VPAKPLRQCPYQWGFEVETLACVSEGVADFLDDDQIAVSLIVYKFTLTGFPNLASETV
jgi:hypothetical protein